MRSRELTVNDGVADSNRAVADHIGAQPATVHEAAENAGLGQALEVSARLAEPLAQAFDLPDHETFTDERVQVDAARDDVPASLLGREPELVEDLRLDERQVVTARVLVRKGPRPSK